MRFPKSDPITISCTASRKRSRSRQLLLVRAPDGCPDSRVQTMTPDVMRISPSRLSNAMVTRAAVWASLSLPGISAACVIGPITSH